MSTIIHLNPQDKTLTVSGGLSLNADETITIVLDDGSQLSAGTYIVGVSHQSILLGQAEVILAVAADAATVILDLDSTTARDIFDLSGNPPVIDVVVDVAKDGNEFTFLGRGTAHVVYTPATARLLYSSSSSESSLSSET